MVLMPSSRRSTTGSGRSARSISLVLRRKCFIDTPTPCATSGKNASVAIERAPGVATMTSVGAAGFLGKGFIYFASGLHRGGLGPAARHRVLRGRPYDPASVPPRPRHAERRGDDERHRTEEDERLRHVLRHLEARLDQDPGAIEPEDEDAG